MVSRIIPGAFILDTDGTVALHTEEERSHFDYTKVKYDRPNMPIIELAEMLNRWLIPLVVTGRMDIGNCRSDTVAWYRKHFSQNFCNDMRLYMRPAQLRDGSKDYRKDYIVKKEIYYNFLKNNYDIKYAIDDRLQVCRMWHGEGLNLLRVGDPDADF